MTNFSSSHSASIAEEAESLLAPLTASQEKALEQYREELLHHYYQAAGREDLETLAHSILERPQLSTHLQEKILNTIYLDNAATCPPLVKTDLLLTLGSPGRSSGTRELDQALEEAKISAYRFLNNQPSTQDSETLKAQAERFAFTSGCTDSLNQLASTLEDFWRQALSLRAKKAKNNSKDSSKDKDNSKKDNKTNNTEPYYLVLAINNHHANLAPWLELSRRLPEIKVLVVPYLESPTTSALDSEFDSTCDSKSGSTSLSPLLSSFYSLEKTQELLAKVLPQADAYLSQDYLSTNPNYRDKAGHLDYPSLEEFLALKGDRVLLFSLSSIANANGLANDLNLITNLKERYSPQALTVFDNAQGSLFVPQALEACQLPLGLDDKRSWTADFIVGSFHKMHGPPGLGYIIMGDKLWAKQEATLNKQARETSKLASLLSLQKGFNKASNEEDHAKQNHPEQADPEQAAFAKLAKLFPTASIGKDSSSKDLANSTASANVDSNNESTEGKHSVIDNKQSTIDSKATSTSHLEDHLNNYLALYPLRPQRVGGGLIQHLEVSYGVNNLEDYKLIFNSTNPFTKGGTENYLSILEAKEIFATLTPERLASFYPLLTLLREYFLTQLILNIPQVLDLRKAFAGEIKKILAEEKEDLSYSLAILPSAGTHISLILPEDGASDLAIYLENHNVVVRTGKHCAYPHHAALGLDSTLRLSIGLLNNINQIDYVVLLIKNFIAENF